MQDKKCYDPENWRILYNMTLSISSMVGIPDKRSRARYQDKYLSIGELIGINGANIQDVWDQTGHDNRTIFKEVPTASI